MFEQIEPKMKNKVLQLYSNSSVDFFVHQCSSLLKKSVDKCIDLYYEICDIEKDKSHKNHLELNLLKKCLK